MNRPASPSSLRLSWWAVLAAASLPVLFAPPASAAPPRAIAVEGEPFAGRPIAVDAAGNVRFDVEGQPRDLPLADLVVWGEPYEQLAGTQVLLTDGGLVVADVTGLADDALSLDSFALGGISLPVERVAGILYRVPRDSAERDLLTDRLTSPDGSADRLLLENGDELTGTLTALNDVEAALLRDGQTLTVELDRLTAIAFNPRLARRPVAGGLRVVVGLEDGSRVTARALTMDETQAALQVAGEATWTVPADAIVSLQPLGGRAVYLSDLKPSGYRHIPFLSVAWPYGEDRNVHGARLRRDGRLYLKGIGLHSTARLTYPLERPYRRFEAEICLDDSAGRGGSAVFRVFVDRQERYASPVVRGDSPPIAISVDVTGGQSLSLVVDFAERGDERDDADWLNARLME
jgi:hypothetical protein